MKVVYNACCGGFSLSDAAIERYLAIKGWSFTKEVSKYGFPTYKVVEQERWYHRGIPRDDPALVQVVEEMGNDANGAYASLVITDIPVGTRWRIDEYDGSEQVMTVDDYEWHTAT